MKTIRRDKLMRLAQAGKLICTRSYHYDDMTGQEISKKEIPVVFRAEGQPFREGFINLQSHDFTSSSGYASLSDDGQSVSLGVHGNCHYDFRIIDGDPAALCNKGVAKAHRPENARMQAFLSANGIECTPKYIPDGSLKRSWRLADSAQKWTPELAAKLTALGFVNYDGRPLDDGDGNGGMFCVFVRGHDEFLVEPETAHEIMMRQPVQAPAQILGIIKTKHTQKGYDLFVVKLGERVSRETFSKYLSEARELGGWWSSYAADGAIPGFQFKTEIKARAFLHVLDGKPSLEQIQSEPTQAPAPAEPVKSMAEKFRALAEGLTAKIEDKRRPMTQNPTPKRNREYRSRLHDSDNLERVQKALLALTAAHEVQTVPPELAHIKTKAQIEPLVYKGTEGGGYYEVIPSLNYRDISPAGKALQAMIEQPNGQDKAREISLLEQTISLTNIPGFFPTPKTLVERMIEWVNPKPNDRILEPSAGTGAIACALNHGTKVEALEVNFTLRKLLALKGVNLVGDDFVEFQPTVPYDGVLMNPPFESGQDIAHIRKAFDCLKSGARMAAICSPGFTFRNDANHTAFREWLNEIGAEVKDIPAGAFQRSGTGVAAKMILIQK